MQDSLKSRFSIRSEVWISLTWVFGIIAGYKFICSDPAFFRNKINFDFSLISVCCCILFQLLYTLFLCIAAGDFIFYVLLFAKATSYGICSSFIFCFWGVSGYLIHNIILFLSSLLFVLMYLFQHIVKKPRSSKEFVNIILCIMTVILLCILQLFFSSCFYFYLVNLL